MKNVLMIEGSSVWDGYLKHALRQNGYGVESVIPNSFTVKSLSQFAPDLILLSGCDPCICWPILRRLAKQYPALIYHISNAKGVDETLEAVDEAFRDMHRKAGHRRKPALEREPLQYAKASA